MNAVHMQSKCTVGFKGGVWQLKGRGLWPPSGDQAEKGPRGLLIGCRCGDREVVDQLRPDAAEERGGALTWLRGESLEHDAQHLQHGTFRCCG